MTLSCPEKHAAQAGTPAATGTGREPVPVNWTPHVLYAGHSVPVPSRYREAGGDLLILLHGLGCSKDNFDGAFAAPCLRGYSILTLDFPGHGACGQGAPGFLCKPESCAAITRLAVDQLAECRGRAFARVHVAGHGMGGAVAVILAAEGRVVTGWTVSAAGHLTSTDCGMASRGIARQSRSGFSADGHRWLTARLVASGRPDLGAWASWLAEADPAAVHTAATSLIDWSDSGDLLAHFNALPARAFIHGDREDKRHLHGRLQGAPVSVVPGGHFPMIDAPSGFYLALTRALALTTPGTGDPTGADAWHQSSPAAGGAG